MSPSRHTPAPADWLVPVVLEGRHARLEPLQPDHAAALAEAVRDGELWNLWYTQIPAPEAMAAEIERRLRLHREGRMLPFTVRDAAGVIVGMTSFMTVEPAHRRVEIGSTWYAQRVQRTAVNTECKRMLLQHAFEILGCIAVELRTHFMNRRSRAAIERLGARQDGILRNHQIDARGELRDTVVFSILEHEWPVVRRHLQERLGAS